ncbi:MAG: hypothetical protein ACYTAF_10810 [Planctomycetota bacterium]|jgi:hypothetical protein
MNLEPTSAFPDSALFIVLFAACGAVFAAGAALGARGMIREYPFVAVLCAGMLLSFPLSGWLVLIVLLAPTFHCAFHHAEHRTALWLQAGGLTPAFLILLGITIFAGSPFLLLPENEVVSRGRYANSDLGFSMEFPTDWIIRKGTTRVAARSLDQDEFVPGADRTMIVERGPSGSAKRSAEDWAEEEQRKRRRLRPGPPLESGSILVGGLDAHRTLFATNGSRRIVYYIVSGTDRYVIACYVSARTYEEQGEALERACRSFRTE